MRERVIAVIVGWSVTGVCAVLGVLFEPSVFADVLGLLAMLAGLSVLLLTALVAAELMSRAAGARTEPRARHRTQDRPEPGTHRAA